MTDVTATADLFTPAALANPYPIYARLRSEQRARWTGWDWQIYRYADVQAALRDSRLGADRIEPDPNWLRESGMEPLFRAHQKMMLFSDPPDHTRLRSLVNRAFTPRTVEQMRPRVQQLVDGLLDQAAARGEIDLIRDLAYPLPVTVIADMLGVPTDMHEQFRDWSDGVAAFIGGTTRPEAEVLASALRSVLEMAEFFVRLADERRRSPRDDLLTALALAEDAGDRLSEEELVANCILLLVAGHETTTNLIGNGVLALLRHPGQLALLHERPELTVGAVEELLRYDSPVQVTSRRAHVDLEFAGVSIGAGASVSILIGSANRDPEQFADPDQLDITRGEVRHLSFSHGPHFCLGAPLARLEGQVAIGTLARRFPQMRLATEQLEWRDNFALRGLRALPLSL